MDRRARAVLLPAFVAIVVTAGCAGDDEPSPPAESGSPSGSPGTSALEPLWTTPDLHLASRPAAVGDTVVAYVAAADTIALAGFDPESGEELWRVPSTASRITPGVSLSVVADDRYAYHYSPIGEPTVGVPQAVDVTTGEPAWTGATQAQFSSSLEYCDDTETTLCGSVRESADGTGLFTVGVDGSGEVLDTGAPAGRALGSGLFDLGGDDEEEIARYVDGSILWQRPPSELFDGRAVSPDFGWSWEEVGDDLLVGTFGVEADQEQTGPRALQPEYTAGIDAATGETRWVEEGSFYCNRIGGLDLTVDDASPMVRCRTSGTFTPAEGESGAATYDVGAVIEGFDPATGATTWSVELPEFNALLDDDLLMVRTSPGTFASATDDGSLFSLDLATGEKREAAQDEIGWCQRENVYPYPESYLEDFPSRRGHFFSFPCDLAGAPAPAPAAVDEGVGALAGDVFVWIDEDGLHGARVPSS